MADIIICVHNALDDVRRCLGSVWQTTSDEHTLVIVDDGSDRACRDFLVDVARARPRTHLIRNDEPQGYTKAANQGLRCASADFRVLLNSDTIVTPGWLEGLLACAESDPRIGIVGPLSNAGGYQSIPRVFAGKYAFAVNRLPPGWDPARFARFVSLVSPRAFPRLGVINGFCFGVKRTVIDTIGYLDEEHFPDAYGEETDYCLRATRQGFELAVADHVYVYHAKSRSYELDRRLALSRQGEEALRRKHGRETLLRAYARSQHEPTLAALRQRIHAYLRKRTERLAPRPPNETIATGRGTGTGEATRQLAESDRPG